MRTHCGRCVFATSHCAQKRQLLTFLEIVPDGEPIEAVGIHINTRKSRMNTEFGGARRDRTADLYNAIVALSQLSYGPGIRVGEVSSTSRKPRCAPAIPPWPEASGTLRTALAPVKPAIFLVRPSPCGDTSPRRGARSFTGDRDAPRLPGRRLGSRYVPPGHRRRARVSGDAQVPHVGHRIQVNRGRSVPG